MGLSHLSLMQMSFSGAVFILVIILLRAVAINRLPKKMFLILWGIALIRLLVPLSVPSAVSVYSIIGRMPISIQQSGQPALQQEQSGQMQQSDLSRQSQPLQQSTEQLYPSQTEQTQSQQLQSTQQPQSQQSELTLSLPAFVSEQLQMQPQQETSHAFHISVWFIVRCVGTVLCVLFFAASYLRWYFRFRTSVPVNNNYVQQWLKKHRLKRPISIRQSDRTAAPLTYGVFRPVILLPQKTDWADTEQLQYVLLHEYVHIRRFDTATKFVTTIALCIHWFNPFVWVMYVLFNRDLELSCDESVVRFLGISSKTDYARVLINMEAKKSGRMPLYNNFSKNAIEERIKSIMKIKNTSLMGIIVAVIVVVGLTVVFVTSASTLRGESKDENGVSADNDLSESEQDSNAADNATDSGDAEPILADLVFNIQDFYTTDTGDPSNLYYIDENKVLWGCGRNNYGQLGQGTQDYDFHEDMVKIAENVIHVDYSQSGFTVYLTEDHKLYGMGNAGGGALQQYEQFDETQWLLNGGYDNYTATTPCLLMENVIYARCGRDDVACLDEDNNVWIWGVIGYDKYPVTEIYFESKPVKVLENAVLVTGGLFNHAALLTDGSVWTWGYNYVGNCGVPDKIIVEEPMRVAEDAVMVWTGTTEYNIDCQDISEFGGVYEQQFENTIILKRDGSYWACGVNVGNEEKVLAQYWETSDYPVVCSSEFLPYENPKVAYNSNYYHSISDVDDTSVYLGGVGGIYEINRFAVGTIYSAPHIAGAALYKNYVYSIEYNVTGNGMTADLIRFKKDGSGKEALIQISGASYDLRIVDNILVISEYNMEDSGPVILFYAYTLDNEGNLTSDTPQDAYVQFGLPNGYEDGMHFLINPWFSTQSLGYTCFIKAAGVMNINSVWIMWEGQETAEEVVTCYGQPLLTGDTIFYCDSNRESLIQRSLNSTQETVLYEIPDDTGLTLLTYDSEWVYFLEYSLKLREDDNTESGETIRRVNLQNHSIEEIYVLQPGSYGGNFNVYGNYCYFILSGAGSNRWVRYNMTNGEMTTIPEEY